MLASSRELSEIVALAGRGAYNTRLHQTAATVFFEFCRRWPPQVSQTPFDNKRRPWTLLRSPL